MSTPLYMEVSQKAKNDHLPCCWCSVTKSGPTLWDPMGCSTPGFHVFHYLPNFVQTHVHWVNDSIQPSHPLSSPSPTTFNLSQHQGLFKCKGSVLCIRWPNWCWSFSLSISTSNEYSALISFRMVLLDLLAVQETQKSCPTPQFKSINFSVLSFLYTPSLTCIHDYWKSHNFH